MLPISRHVSLSGHHDVALFMTSSVTLNQHKIDNNIFASLKSEPICKLINRIPGSSLLTRWDNPFFNLTN